MKLASYPAYTETGLEWLGAVPAHWGICRFSREIAICEGLVDPEREPFASRLLIAPNHIESGTGRLLARETAAEQGAESGKYLCRRGEVIYSKIRPALSKATIAPEDCLCSADMYPLDGGRRVHNPYLCWLLLSTPFVAWSVLESDRVAMPKINRETLGGLSVPVPPLAEQRAIADFLDARTSKLDTLVEKKRSFLEKLKEKRATLISRTVTRGLPAEVARTAGLDPSPKLKPSGVTWLGDVPAHWDVKPLMYLTDEARPIMYGIVLPGPDIPDGVPIVKGGDVKPGRLTLDNLCRTTPEIEAGYARSRLKAGDIVFSIRGSIGDSELVPEEIEGANLTQDAARIAPRRDVDGRWLLYAVRAKSTVDPLLAKSLGAAVRGVNIRDLKRAKVPVPGYGEQVAIANYLEHQVAQIDRMVEKVQAAVEQLQQYRSALITAAVTGKVDVRDVDRSALQEGSGA